MRSASPAVQVTLHVSQTPIARSKHSVISWMERAKPSALLISTVRPQRVATSEENAQPKKRSVHRKPKKRVKAGSFSGLTLADIKAQSHRIAKAQAAKMQPVSIFNPNVATAPAKPMRTVSPARLTASARSENDAMPPRPLVYSLLIVETVNALPKNKKTA